MSIAAVHEKATSAAPPERPPARFLAPEVASLNSGELSKGFQEWLQSVQPPIEFYGKVVDERDQPVPGASVDFLWTHVHPEADFKTNIVSDARGLFSLAGVSGAALDVHVQKPGYYAVKSLDRNNFNYVRLPGDHPFAPDPTNPVPFHLRKKGPGTALITSHYGMSPDLEVTVPRNGVPVLVDLLSRKVGSGGHLQITQTKPEYLEAKSATAWSFQMHIPSGGFVEQNDEFPFEAPATGYEAVVAFRFSKSETNWARGLTKSYYISFGQPPRYGWLTVETGIGWGGARLQYAINPDGSRYLEPK